MIKVLKTILIIIAVVVLIGLLRGPSEKIADTILKPEQANNVTERNVDSRYAPPEQNYNYEQQKIPKELDEVNQLIQKADEQYEYERYDTALEYYDEALEIEPQNEAAWRYKDCSLDLSNNYEEAIKYFDNALSIEPNDAFVLKWKGDSLCSLGKYNEAIKCYDKALEIDFYAALK